MMASSPGSSNSLGIRTAWFRPFLNSLTCRSGICLGICLTFSADKWAGSIGYERVYVITGAGHGMGLDIAKAALAAGHTVIATGRNPKKVTGAIGHHADLLTIKLDVTRLEEAQAAVAAAVAKFGRIDVLVNNAGNFYAGFFEELSPEQVRNQIETLLFGPMNVTRAVLPVMHGTAQ